MGKHGTSCSDSLLKGIIIGLGKGRKSEEDWEYGEVSQKNGNLFSLQVIGSVLSDFILPS